MARPVIVDYHMHLRAPDESLDHTVEGVERFVEVARARGVDEIGFSEHVYYFRETADFWDVPYQSERCAYDLERYVDTVIEAKRQGLPVKLGLEVDWVPPRAEELAGVLAAYPWDFLLGSIHFVDGHGIDAEPSLVGALGVEEAWRRYFAELEALAASGLVDVLAHPDLIKFVGSAPGDPGTLYASLAAALEPTGVALEISTAGRHKPHGQLYPDAKLLEDARRVGVPVTLASDAHVPERVGRDFDLGLAHARAAGYETVTVFDGRAARQEPLG